MQTRQVVALVTVIALIALALGATIGYSFFTGRTSTTTTTQTYTTSVSVTTTQTTFATPYNRTSQLYELRFNQSSFCNPPSFLIPWSVTLEISEGTNITITQPMNSTVQCCSGSTSYRPYSTIVFTVPNGTYLYAVSEEGLSITPSSGNVTVNGQNTTVMLQEQDQFSCGTIATTSSSSS
jgi:hypothetical protein